MKRAIILSLFFLTFFNCSVKEKPEFIGIENINILEATQENLILKADAIFENPNDIGGEMQLDKVKVYVNGSEMAYVSSEAFKVPANKNFSIPLKAKVPVLDIFDNTDLGGLIGSLVTKKIKVQYKGVILYKVFGFSHTYNIDKTEEVKLK